MGRKKISIVCVVYKCCCMGTISRKLHSLCMGTETLANCAIYVRYDNYHTILLFKGIFAILTVDTK